MAQIPSLKKLIAEDFKEQNSWIPKLLSPINEFFSKVAAALNNDLTFADNVRAQVTTLDVKQEASGTFPIKFKPKYSYKPIGLWVANVQEISANPGVLTSAVYAAWEVDEKGQISIRNISGLTIGKRYSVTMIISFG